jgi:hypothetical protein
MNQMEKIIEENKLKFNGNLMGNIKVNNGNKDGKSKKFRTSVIDEISRSIGSLTNVKMKRFS